MLPTEVEAAVTLRGDQGRSPPKRVVGAGSGVYCGGRRFRWAVRRFASRRAGGLMLSPSSED